MELPPELQDLARPLAPGLTFLRAARRFPSANGLLVEGGGETVLVDAGLDEPMLRHLAPRVDRVVLTHFHFDHVMGLRAFDREKLWMNEVEAPFMAGAAAAVEGVGAAPEDRESIARFFDAIDYPYGAFDHVYKPSGTLDVGGRRLRIVPAPGHSPAHFLLHDADAGVLYSTDVEFSGPGPWYAWPHCDPDAFEASLRAARPLFESARVVATSHSPPVPGSEAAVALDAFLAHFGARDEAVRRALVDAGRPLDLDELVSRTRLFYGAALDAAGGRGGLWATMLRYWCRVMTRLHVERLERRGLARLDGRLARAAAP